MRTSRSEDVVLEHPTTDEGPTACDAGASAPLVVLASGTPTALPALLLPVLRRTPVASGSDA